MLDAISRGQLQLSGRPSGSEMSNETFEGTDGSSAPYLRA